MIPLGKGTKWGGGKGTEEHFHTQPVLCLSVQDPSKTPGGGLKLRVVLNPVYATLFSCTHTPMMKFNL